MRERTIGSGSRTASVSEICFGAMNLGTTTDEETSYALLDRFLEAGGTFIDTAENYNQWASGDVGGQSEELIGRWMRSRGVRDRVVIATKTGARTKTPGDPMDWIGLSGKAIREGVEASLRRLGVERIDLYYAHIDDRATPLEETVQTLGSVADEGKATVLGCSNTTVWRFERARAIAHASGLPAYTCIQQFHSYLWQHPDWEPGRANRLTGELMDYAQAESDVTLLSYSPLLKGGYTRPDRRPFIGGLEHAANEPRLAVLLEVAKELDATPNQVVLAWMLRTDPPVIPVVASSTVDQLEEQLGAVDLDLDDATMKRLDEAGL